jgi:hypothetical protein
LHGYVIRCCDYSVECRAWECWRLREEGGELDEGMPGR